MFLLLQWHDDFGGAKIHRSADGKILNGRSSVKFDVNCRHDVYFRHHVWMSECLIFFLTYCKTHDEVCFNSMGYPCYHGPDSQVWRCIQEVFIHWLCPRDWLETEKAHYHIAIQFDEPKDDNSVRYAVKKHFQVKGNGLYLSRYGMVFPHTLPISTKGILK